jgi:superfamily II DNA or RNA helicase
MKVSLDDEDWSPETVALEGETKNAIRRAVERASVAVFDEAHFLACDTIQSIFKASKNCCYIMGMSGTPWRDDGADLLLESVCGPRVFDMSASELIDAGWLVPPKIAFVEIPAPPEALPKSWKTVYSRYVIHNPVRNKAIIDAAKTLVGMGRKVLILVRSLVHGKNLVDMADDLSIFFVNGRLDSWTRADAKERFEAGEIQCLVASSVFDIGIDLPSLDALIMAGGGKSTVRVLQRIGRVIRIHDGKADAIVMDFMDNARYLNRHSSTRLALYETESRFRVRLPQGFDRRRLKKVLLQEKIWKQ